MEEYKIEIVVQVPDGTTHKQVKEWAEFCTGYTGSLESNNPIYELRGSDIEAIRCYVERRS